MTCLAFDSHPDAIIQCFESICEDVAKNLTKSVKSRDPLEIRWFNAECSKEQKDLKKALHAVPRDRALIKTVRQTYKSVIKRRKDELRRLAWKILKELVLLRIQRA